MTSTRSEIARVLTNYRTEEIILFRTTLVNAIAALDALMRGNRLVVFLDDLENVSSSLNTAAVLPMLLKDWMLLSLDGQHVQLFILDVFNRRGYDCHLSVTPSPERDQHVMSWHQSVLKILCGNAPLDDQDLRNLREVREAMRILSVECQYPDSPERIAQRLSEVYATAVV